MMIGLCFLNDYQTLEIALSETLNCSKQLLKKNLTHRERKLTVKKGREYKIDINLLNHLIINPQFIGSSVDAIAETSNILALSKPPSLHCAPLSYLENNNLLSYLRSINRSDILAINQSHYDRALLHRLDFETSGLVLLAKSENYLKNVFTDRAKYIYKKYYLAVTKGVVPNGAFQHYADIHKNKKVIYDPNGVVMNLDIYNIHANREYSLLLIELKQGHRHQIRFQLSELGHPIVGDQLYGDHHADRMYLHCFSYLVDDSGKRWLTCHPDQLFYKFFDINSTLEMVANKLRSLEIG